MQKITSLLIVLTFSSFTIFAQSSSAEKEIRAVLALQDAEWNRGNIAGFMETYWKSDSLMFIGKSGITYGWQKTLDNYKKGYPDTAAMGKLRFELIEFKQLSKTACFVVGKWFLTRSIGNLNGAFTLLLRKINNRWVIVADHSS
jgi:hypothetical protein